MRRGCRSERIEVANLVELDVSLDVFGEFDGVAYVSVSDKPRAFREQCDWCEEYKGSYQVLQRTP
jgi:hypothetical protein